MFFTDHRGSRARRRAARSDADNRNHQFGSGVVHSLLALPCRRPL